MLLFELNNHKTDTQTKAAKQNSIEETAIIWFNFIAGLELTGFRTTQLCILLNTSPRSNRKPAHGQRSTLMKDMTSMSYKLEPAIWSPAIWSRPIWSADNLIWQVSIDHNMMSYIKKVHWKPRLHVSVNLLVRGRPPSCTTPQSSSPSPPSCERAHEQYR